MFSYNIFAISELNLTGNDTLLFSPIQRASLVETDLLYADALWDHNPRDSQELSFRANEIIEVLDMSNDDWWFGCIGAKSGWFPTSFVRVRAHVLYIRALGSYCCLL